MTSSRGEDRAGHRRLRPPPRTRSSTKGAFPCVTGVSCSPWPRCSASACFAYSPFDADWWLPNAPGNHHHVVSTFGREIDSLFVIILWITGIVFIGTQIVLVWESFAVRRPARAGGDLLPRQPAARGDLDDHPGGDPGLHRALPDGDLGRDQVPELGAEGPAAGRDHRAAVPVGHALPRPRRPAAHDRRRPPGQRPALRQGEAGADLPAGRRTCSTRSSCRSCGSSRTPSRA